MYDALSVPRGCAAVTPAVSGIDPALDTSPGSGKRYFRGVWIDVGGNLKVTFSDGSVGVFIVVAGTLFEGQIQLVWSTGTTATVVYGVW